MLGDSIARLRKEKKWTQEKLAEATSLSRGYIAAIEEGRVKPKLRTLSIIAEILGVTIEQLCGEVENDDNIG